MASANRISPSRHYVAMCNKANFDGFYFRQFALPETDKSDHGRALDNNADVAGWYFLNRIDFIACLECCFAAEDLLSVRSSFSL